MVPKWSYDENTGLIKLDYTKDLAKELCWQVPLRSAKYYNVIRLAFCDVSKDTQRFYFENGFIRHTKYDNWDQCVKTRPYGTQKDDIGVIKETMKSKWKRDRRFRVNFGPCHAQTYGVMN